MWFFMIVFVCVCVQAENKREIMYCVRVCVQSLRVINLHSPAYTQFYLFSDLLNLNQIKLFYLGGILQNTIALNFGKILVDLK